MKKNSIYILLFFTACTTDTQTADTKQTFDTIPTLTLPVKQQADKLFDSVTRKILLGDITLLLKYEKREIFPVLIYSANKFGHTIDSLPLLQQMPYYGVDSHYNPFIEINADGTIIRIDTVISTKPIDQNNDNSVFKFKTDTIIRMDKFTVDQSGKFTVVKKTTP